MCSGTAVQGRLMMARTSPPSRLVASRAAAFTAHLRLRRARARGRGPAWGRLPIGCPTPPCLMLDTWNLPRSLLGAHAHPLTAVEIHVSCACLLHSSRGLQRRQTHSDRYTNLGLIV